MLTFTVYLRILEKREGFVTLFSLLCKDLPGGFKHGVSSYLPQDCVRVSLVDKPDTDSVYLEHLTVFELIHY